MQSTETHKRRPPLLAAFIVLVFAVVVLAACGSDDGGDTTAATNESTEASGDGGESADVTGKTIGYLDVAATSPIEVRFHKAFSEAAKRFDWKVQLQDGAGDPEKSLTAARNFINSGVDAIVTSSVPSEWLLPIKADAESKDIPIVELITKYPPGVYTGQVLENQEPASVKMADFVKEEFPDGAKVALLFEEEIAALVERVEILEREFEGSNIEVVASHNIPIAENPRVQGVTVDTLNANPDLAAFIATSDIQSPEVIAGLRTAGNKEAKLFGWYADTANVEVMEQAPQQFLAVVDSDIAKVGWIAAGELASFFAGGEITEEQDAEYTPIIVEVDDITPGMVAEEGPVPFSEISPPFYEEWEEEFGISAE